MLLSQTCSYFVSKRYIVPTRLTYNILDGTINQAPQLCSVFAARVGLAVFNILKAFSAAASKLETIRQGVSFKVCCERLDRSTRLD
ncbi:hypothetical protein YC2023_092200 [Brassica napus]